jgi:hypothetical protein
MERCLTKISLRVYFDGELSAAEATTVAAHLAACKSCASAAQEMEKGIETLNMAFAPLFSLPVPVAQLHARLNLAVTTLPTPRSDLEARLGLNSSALLFRLSTLLRTVPRPVAGFASLVITLVLITALSYQFNLSMKEVVKDEIGASRGPIANSRPVVSADRKAFEEPVISRVDQAISSQDRRSDAVALKNAGRKSGGLKTLRNARQTSAAQIFTARPDSSPSLARESLIRAEQQYLSNIATLSATLESGPKVLKPILRVEYERNLAVIDVAINATRKAAMENPRDVNASKFLLAAYQSKMDLLRVVASHAEPQSFSVED